MAPATSSPDGDVPALGIRGLPGIPGLFRLSVSHAVFVTAGGGVALAACGAVVWQPLLEARSRLMWTAALANLVACLCESRLLGVVVPGTVLLASCFPSETE